MAVVASGQVTITCINDGATGPQGPQGLQGIQGSTGEQGIQGSTGPTGAASYAHIAYADDATGSGFSQSPTNKAYIGFYSDHNSTDSTNQTDYKWSLIKGADGLDGAQGVPGPAGANGQTTYFHVAYAMSSDGSAGFSTTDPTSKTYIGNYTDLMQNDSINPASYVWAKFQGPTGATGATGPQGPIGPQGPPGANDKSRNFTSQPVPPYDLGDTWTQSGATYYCTKAESSTGAYSLSDWTLQQINLTSLAAMVQSTLNNSLQSTSVYSGVQINSSGFSATAGSTVVSVNSSNGFKISESGSTVFQVDTNGNLSINNAAFSSTNGGITVGINQGSDPLAIKDSSNNYLLHAQQTGDFYIGNNFHVDPSGNVTLSGSIAGSAITGGSITQTINDPTYGIQTMKMQNGALTSSGKDDDGLLSYINLSSYEIDFTHTASTGDKFIASLNNNIFDMERINSSGVSQASIQMSGYDGSITTTGTITAATGLKTGNVSMGPQGMELRWNGGTPYIDFSRNLTDDYDTRVMLNASTFDISIKGSPNTFTLAAGDTNIKDMGTYNATTSSGANMTIDSNGWFHRSTSATKYKIDIAPMDLPGGLVDSIMSLVPKKWHDKAEAQRYAAGEINQLNWYYGLVAEDVEAAGFDQWVSRGADGAIEGLEYERLWIPLIPLSKRHDDQIKDLIARVAELELKVNQLEAS